MLKRGARSKFGWSARVSLANLDDEAYSQIGKNLMQMVRGAVEKWVAAGRPTQ
jgi:hypothetical protein